jgi:toxin ParE1/3/4
VLRLVWSSDARDDLHEIVGYISGRNPAAALRLLETIAYTAERLPEHPFLYRQGRIPETREAVVHPNYIVIYRIETDVIDIIAVIHARQRYP